MPTIRLKNTVPSIRNFNASPIIRIRSGGSVGTTSAGSGTFAGKGYLIGMMALTYTMAQGSGSITTAVSDFKPNIRITNI